jgi:hypothetical protein
MSSPRVRVILSKLCLTSNQVRVKGTEDVQESHDLHVHFVSFSSFYVYTDYGRSRDGGSTHLTVSHAQYPFYQHHIICTLEHQFHWVGG